MIYRNHLAGDHAAIAWASSKLANIYILNGDYEKARKLLENSYLIFRKNYDENNIRNFVALENLGIVHARLGNYTKAQKILQGSLITYEKYYGKGHIETARVLRNIGLSYLCEGQTKPARFFLNKALKIFQQTNHPDIYLVLEDLAELYLKKFSLKKTKDKGNIQKYQNLKAQAISSLNQALKVVKTHFPEDSPYRERIELKIKNMKKRL